MHRLTLLILTISVFTLSSCSYYDHKTKQDFYNLLAGTNDSLDKMTGDWHQLLDKAIASKNFTALAPLRTKMGLFMTRNRARIANIEVPEHYDTLRDNEEAFLASQANVISEAYPPFEGDNDITPDGDIQSQMKEVANDLQNESSANANVRKSLQVFAKKYDLKSLPPIR